MNFAELKQLTAEQINEGAVDAWQPWNIKETENGLQFHANGVLFQGIVQIEPTPHPKYYSVHFTPDFGAKQTTHVASRKHLPILLNTHIERLSEWSDEVYRRKFLQKVATNNYKDIYNAADLIKKGILEKVLLFDADGSQLECKAEGEEMICKNLATNAEVCRIALK